jgi:hypothetical protein
MANLAVLTKGGRAAFVKAMKERPLFLAWGTGDPAWDADGAELPSLVDATALTAEVGRRTAGLTAYAIPDENGSIYIPKGTTPAGEVQAARYSISETPTPYLYVQVSYDFGDASGAQIRELALFMDSVPVDGLPPGQQYFTPSEIADPGLMMVVQIFTPPINRSPAIRQVIEYVMPI